MGGHRPPAIPPPSAQVRTERLERWHLLHDREVEAGKDRSLACKFADANSGDEDAVGEQERRATYDRLIEKKCRGEEFTREEELQARLFMSAGSWLWSAPPPPKPKPKPKEEGLWMLVEDPEKPPLIAQVMGSGREFPLVGSNYVEVFLSPHDLRQAALRKLHEQRGLAPPLPPSAVEHVYRR